MCIRDSYKTGGYNLESAKANEIRLNNLILLIAISYTLNSLVKFLEIVMRYI